LLTTKLQYSRHQASLIGIGIGIGVCLQPVFSIGRAEFNNLQTPAIKPPAQNTKLLSRKSGHAQGSEYRFCQFAVTLCRKHSYRGTTPQTLQLAPRLIHWHSTELTGQEGRTIIQRA
jgi:hypothetical protein